MPNFAINATVPAGGSVANALAGSPFEFVGRNAKVAIALAMSDVVGGNPGVYGDIIANITFGSELQLQNGTIPNERAAGAGALIPDNVQVDDVAVAGDRLVVELLNSAGTAVDVRGIVRILFG